VNAYHVWPDNQSELDCGDPIEADSPDEAAELWAEEVDRQAGLEIAKEKDSPRVCVKDLSTGTIARYEVIGELLPSYSAMVIE
jgi:hypothetical protein